MDFKTKVEQLNHLRCKRIEASVLSILKNTGVQFEDGYIIEDLSASNFAGVDPDEIFYYYSGPLDDKTREFCQELLLLSKFFTQSDIDSLSSKAGYDVNKYKGSYQCRHKWLKARIKGKIKNGYTPDKPTGNELNRIGRTSIEKNK